MHCKIEVWHAGQDSGKLTQNTFLSQCSKHKTSSRGLEFEDVDNFLFLTPGILLESTSQILLNVDFLWRLRFENILYLYIHAGCLSVYF